MSVRFKSLLQALSSLLPIVALSGGLLLIFSSQPSGTVHACQPCACTVGTTLNCYGHYALFTPVDSKTDECRIDIYRLVDNRRGRRIIRITPQEQAELAEFPETNILIEAVGDVALYKLTTGEYQINNGPDDEGKVHVINWTGCPAENVYESSFTIQPPAEATEEATETPGN